jgi:PIN domain
VTVTVVLDTSAVLAYTKGSIAVGELLAIVADDGDTVLIPASCLAAACRHVANGGDEALLRLLSTAPSVALAPLTPEQAMEVGAKARRATGIDAGHAAAEAIIHDAQLATQEPAEMSRLLPTDWPIIGV